MFLLKRTKAVITCIVVNVLLTSAGYASNTLIPPRTVTTTCWVTITVSGTYSKLSSTATRPSPLFSGEGVTFCWYPHPTPHTCRDFLQGAPVPPPKKSFREEGGERGGKSADGIGCRRRGLRSVPNQVNIFRTKGSRLGCTTNMLARRGRDEKHIKTFVKQG